MIGLNLFQRAALRRNAIVRTWVLGGTLAVFILLHVLKRGEGFEGPVAPFAAVWALGAAVNFLLASLATRKAVPPWIFSAEKGSDLVLCAVLSTLTGGSASPLTSLFFLTVFAAQIDLSEKAARWVQVGAVVLCLASEMFSSGPDNADYAEWVFWSLVFGLVTTCSSRVVAPFRRDANRYESLQGIRREAEERLAAGVAAKDFPRFLVDRLTNLFGFQHGVLLRYDPKARELVLKAAVNIPLEGQALLLRQAVGPDAQGVGVLAAYEKRTTFLRQISTNTKLPPLLRGVFEDAGSDRLSAVPMMHGGELVGVALLSSAGGGARIEDEEVAFLEFACGLAGGYLRRWEDLPPPS